MVLSQLCLPLSYVSLRTACMAAAGQHSKPAGRLVNQLATKINRVRPSLQTYLSFVRVIPSFWTASTWGLPNKAYIVSRWTRTGARPFEGTSCMSSLWRGNNCTPKKCQGPAPSAPDPFTPTLRDRLRTPRHRRNRHPSGCLMAAILGTSGHCLCGSTASTCCQPLHL